ncbi:MAG: hypothetical protein CMJ62_02850 [Planctomycetaceae bacterium]|nr:hypothetical protein [Planctomycetaceae bacterium]
MLSLARTLDFNAEAGIDARAEAKIPAETPAQGANPVCWPTLPLAQQDLTVPHYPTIRLDTVACPGDGLSRVPCGQCQLNNLRKVAGPMG